MGCFLFCDIGHNVVLRIPGHHHAYFIKQDGVVFCVLCVLFFHFVKDNFMPVRQNDNMRCVRNTQIFLFMI